MNPAVIIPTLSDLGQALLGLLICLFIIGGVFALVEIVANRDAKIPS